MYIDIHTRTHTYIVGVGPFLYGCWGHLSIKNKHGSEKSHFDKREMKVKKMAGHRLNGTSLFTWEQVSRYSYFYEILLRRQVLE